MSIGKKLEQVADLVYEKGYEEGSKNSIDLSDAKHIEKLATGKVIRLDDVSEIPHKVKIKAGATSKNKLPYPYKSTTKTVNGITYTDNGDGSVTVEGTATEYTMFYFTEEFPFKVGQTYTFGEDVVGVDMFVRYKDENGATKYGTKKITWKEGYTLLAIYLQVNPGSTTSGTVYPYLVEGDTYDGIWEPYIPPATEPVEVKIYGKNLFNNDTSLLKEVTYQGSTTQGTRIGYEPITLPAGEYTFTLKELDTSFTKYVYGIINDKDGNFISTCHLMPGGVYKEPVSITVNDGDKVYIYDGHTSLLISERAKTFKAVQIQLEPGPISTDFEAFKEPQTITATPEGTEVSSICPVMNIIADSDVTVGYWGSWGKYEKELEIWKSFTVDGKRSSYQYGMAYSDFSEHTIPEGLCTPKASIGNMFYAYAGVTLPKGIDCSGFNAETSTTSYYLNIFGYSSKLRRIYDMGIPALKSYASCYRSCSSLEIIEVIRVNENTAFDSNSFNGCNNLIHVGFVGTIGKNINLQWSKKLNLESVINLFKCLKTFDTTEGSPTVTLSTETWALTETDEYKAEFDGMTGEAVCRAKCWNKA